MNSKYTWLWSIWIIFFGVVEWRAITNKEPDDTLSAHVWKLIGKRQYQKQGLWLLWRVLLGGGLVWAIFHFFGSA